MGQKLGQHFLTNKNIIGKIADAINPQEGDFIFEIGPGHGELTKEILAGCNKFKKCKVFAIEADKELADDLKNKKFENLELLQGDVLKILPSLPDKYELKDSKFKIVGNIPYYITGHLLRIIGELKNKPSKTTLMIQKEVAERICAKPPRSNLLSMSVQFWSGPKILFTVPKNDFSPPPKIESAVILLETLPESETVSKIADKYYSFIKKAFKQPRKTLLNNLVSGGYNREEAAQILNVLHLTDKDRPQSLSVDAVKRLISLP